MANGNVFTKIKQFYDSFLLKFVLVLIEKMIYLQNCLKNYESKK